MDHSSDSLGMPPAPSGRRSPVRYLESVRASGPAMKHVLYVEVVPKGFVKVERVSDNEENEQDPLMTVSPSPHPPPTLLPTKKKKSKEKHQQRQEKRERKVRERDVKHQLEEINNKECNQIQKEIKEEIKEEERYDDKNGSIDGYNSPFSGLHSPDRSSSPDWPPSPKKKPARRKKKEIDHTSSSFACNRSNCDYTTMELTELNSHKKNDHKGRKDFQCDQCIYRGATASDLRKHYRQHSGEIPYSCKMSGCNFRAKHNNSLVYHTKKYHPTGEPIKCDASEACIFTTYLKAALKHHKMMQHGGGKSLACEICPYKCYLMADLRKHHRVHTGENPYACDFEGCRYACKISSNLKKHKRIHTEEKPYFCDACDFRTNFINSLKVHKRTHTNERPYCCEQCGYRCNHTSNLKKHVARLHPGATYSIVRRPCLDAGTGAAMQTDS